MAQAGRPAAAFPPPPAYTESEDRDCQEQHGSFGGQTPPQQPQPAFSYSPSPPPPQPTFRYALPQLPSMLFSYAPTSQWVCGYAPLPLPQMAFSSAPPLQMAFSYAPALQHPAVINEPLSSLEPDVINEPPLVQATETVTVTWHCELSHYLTSWSMLYLMESLHVVPEVSQRVCRAVPLQLLRRQRQ